MENYKFTREEYDKINQYLLFELGMTGIMNESQVKKIYSMSTILNETVDVPEEIESLFEQEKELETMRIKYENNVINITAGYKGEAITYPVDPRKVESAWRDLSNSRGADILVALGVPPLVVSAYESQSKSNFSNRLDRVRKEFEKYARLTPDVASLSPLGSRSSVYSGSTSIDRLDRQEDPEDPGRDAISRRGPRNDKTISRINNAEIIPGEFYRDVTRISPSRTNHWLRFWKNDLKNVEKNKRSLLGRLIGRTWRRTFLLGYQVNRTIFYEVWYNSIDSSFAVYDRNGVAVSQNVPTLQEAIRSLTITIAQNTGGDYDVFASGMQGNELARSLQRSLHMSTEANIRDVMKGDELRQREAAREYSEKRAEERKQSQERKQRMDKFKNKQDASVKRNVRNAVSSSRDAVLGASFTGRDYAEKAAKSAAIAAAGGISSARQGIDYVRRRLQSQISDLEDYMRDPAGTSRTKIDPKIADYFGDLNDPDVASTMAKEAQANLYIKLRILDNISNKEDDDAFTSSFEEYVKKFGRDAAKSPDEHFEEAGEAALGKVGRNALSRAGASFNRVQESFFLSEQTDNMNDGLRQFNRETQAAKSEEDERTKERLDKVAAQNTEIDLTYGHQHDLTDNAFDRQSEKIKQQARNSSYTKQMLLKDINNSIEIYDVTKIRRASIAQTVRSWLSVGRGRRSSIDSPLDRSSFFSRAKQAFFGESYRADFIMGYSFENVINLEIWYITETNPGDPSGRLISSFYVYDVSAQKIIRSHLPFMRNANQVISAKLGVQ